MKLSFFILSITILGSVSLVHGAFDIPSLVFTQRNLTFLPPFNVYDEISKNNFPKYVEQIVQELLTSGERTCSRWFPRIDDSGLMKMLLHERIYEIALGYQFWLNKVSKLISNSTTADVTRDQVIDFDGDYFNLIFKRAFLRTFRYKQSSLSLFNHEWVCAFYFSNGTIELSLVRACDLQELQKEAIWGIVKEVKNFTGSASLDNYDFDFNINETIQEVLEIFGNNSFNFFEPLFQSDCHFNDLELFGNPDADYDFTGLEMILERHRNNVREHAEDLKRIINTGDGTTQSDATTDGSTTEHPEDDEKFVTPSSTDGATSVYSMITKSTVDEDGSTLGHTEEVEDSVTFSSTFDTGGKTLMNSMTTQTTFDEDIDTSWYTEEFEGSVTFSSSFDTDGVTLGRTEEFEESVTVLSTFYTGAETLLYYVTTVWTFEEDGKTILYTDREDVSVTTSSAAAKDNKNAVHNGEDDSSTSPGAFDEVTESPPLEEITANGLSAGLISGIVVLSILILVASAAIAFFVIFKMKIKARVRPEDT